MNAELWVALHEHVEVILIGFHFHDPALRFACNLRCNLLESRFDRSR